MRFCNCPTQKVIFVPISNQIPIVLFNIFFRRAYCLKTAKIRIIQSITSNSICYWFNSNSIRMSIFPLSSPTSSISIGKCTCSIHNIFLKLTLIFVSRIPSYRPLSLSHIMFPLASVFLSFKRAICVDFCPLSVPLVFNPISIIGLGWWNILTFTMTHII